MTLNDTRPARKAGLLAAATALALAPVLSGCFNGPAATTSMQATMNSGDGTQATIGSIRIDNATLVSGPDGSAAGTLIMSLFNDGNEPDVLVGASINGQPAVISGAALGDGGVELAPGAALNFGYQTSDSWLNAYDLEVAPSSYVAVELQFQRSGIAKLSVLTVPAVGFYEGIAPNPPNRPLA